MLSSEGGRHELVIARVHPLWNIFRPIVRLYEYRQLCSRVNIISCRSSIRDNFISDVAFAGAAVVVGEKKNSIKRLFQCKMRGESRKRPPSDE